MQRVPVLLVVSGAPDGVCMACGLASHAVRFDSAAGTEQLGSGLDGAGRGRMANRGRRVAERGRWWEDRRVKSYPAPGLASRVHASDPLSNGVRGHKTPDPLPSRVLSISSPFFLAQSCPAWMNHQRAPPGKLHDAAPIEDVPAAMERADREGHRRSTAGDGGDESRGRSSSPSCSLSARLRSDAPSNSSRHPSSSPSPSAPSSPCDPPPPSSPPTPISPHTVPLPPTPISPVPPHVPLPPATEAPPTFMAAPPSLTPDAVLPLLHCPICRPSRPLSVPLTLRCGHTVCAEHLRPLSPSSTSPGGALTRCPIPTCSGAPAPTTLAPHPDSGVTFVPPPAHFRHSQREDGAADLLAHAHVDITVNKLLGLVQRAQAWFEEGEERVPAFEASDTESESEGEGVNEEDLTEGLYYDPPEASSSNTEQPSHSVAGRSSSRPRSPSPTYSPHRPRKRRRRRLQPLPPASRRPTDRERERERDPGARFEKELLAELTCEICFALLLQPVTTPCQHTFCASCLHRALDHSSACPLCRTALPDYTYFQEHPCNRVVLAILLKAFPGAYEERRAALEAEERDARLDTPVFVCQLSFPGMPTMLHFFEPRYRLMLRRCLATPNPRFGMIPPPRAAPSAASYTALRSTASAASASTSTANLPSAAGNPAPVAQSTGNEYGTMLEIRNVQMLPDGRSVVETWGAWRFRIVERGTLDGYVVARVERVDDWEEEEAEEGRSGTGDSNEVRNGAGDAISEGGGRDAGGGGARGRGIGERSRARTNADLMATCHAFLDELRAGTPWVVHQLNTAYVPMPEDPAAFSFWMGALLPIDEHEKAKLLPIRSARLRLRLVVHWIEQLQSNWARSYASASRLQVVLWWLRRVLIRAMLVGVGPWPYAFVGALLAVFVAQAAVEGVGERPVVEGVGR